MSTERWIESPDLSSQTATLFANTFHREPEGVWAAPGRINVIGEHVDYNEGRCLPAALPHRTFAAVSLRDDSTIRVVSGQMTGNVWSMPLEDVAPGTVTGWPAYLAGVLWALRRDGVEVPGVDVAISSAVPLGAGLSSSAALECSLAIGLAELLGLPTDDDGRQRLAKACMVAENDIAGANTGGMDQAIALRGTEGHALLLDCRTGGVEQIRFNPLAVGLDVLVIDTNAHHELVDGQYAQRRADCDRAAALLGVTALRDVDHLDTAMEDLVETGESNDRLRRRVRHVVSELERVTQAVRILSDGNVAPLGPLLSTSHASLRDDYEVSCPELDVAAETAERAGALGARMIGGGFGGSVIALVPVNDIQRVADAVTTAFAARDFAPPSFLAAPPSAGAHRVA